jgi:hypothetical protein
MGKDSPQQQPSSQSVTQTSIPEYARPYVERMLGKAEAYAETPYQPYQGERIAGFTPMQQQAFQGIQNLQTAPQLQQGSALAGLAGLGSLGAGMQYQGMATDPRQMQAWMSPYQQAVTDIGLREARRQSDLSALQSAGQAARAGAFGGSRFGLQEAERQRNLAQTQADIQAKGSQAAFDAARQAQQFGATLGLQGMGQAGQAAATMGQLGTAEFGQQKDIINAMQNAGAMQQSLEQQRLQQQYQDFLNQRGYPQQQLAFMSDMLRGLPLSQSAQQMYQAPPSMLSQAAGLGFLGKGLGMFAEGGEVNSSSAGLADLALARMSED